MWNTSSSLEEPGGFPHIFMRPACCCYRSESRYLDRATSSRYGSFIWIIKRHPSHLLEICCNMLILLEDTFLWQTFVIINIQSHVICTPLHMVPLCAVHCLHNHTGHLQVGKKEKSPWQHLSITWKWESRLIAVTPGKFSFSKLVVLECCGGGAWSGEGFHYWE